jgi:hypothetical protein
LLGMVLNHRSMLHLLNTFGLLENNVFVDAKTITLYDGQVLSSVNVIKKFDWSTDSFKPKRTWYGWAEEAAQSSEWGGPIPGRFLFLFVHC